MSGDLIHQVLNTWGYVAVFVFVAVESTGIPFPGETMLLTAGAYAGTGNLDIKLVIVAAAAGAILGDNLGFLAGRTWGRDLVIRYGKFVRVDASTLRRAETFFDRHGDKTVFFGRFIALLRTWAAFLAGLNRMPWQKFLAFNAAGGICWATLYGILAFELGKHLNVLERVLQFIGYAGVGVIVVIAAGAYIFHRRTRRRRAASQALHESDHTSST